MPHGAGELLSQGPRALNSFCFLIPAKRGRFDPPFEPNIKQPLIGNAVVKADRSVGVALTETDRGPAFVARTIEAVRGWLADHSDRSRAQRAAGTAFLIRVASAALVYLVQVLLARWMGSFEFGVYVYVWTWVLLLGGLVDLGLATSAQRFIPEYAGTKRLDLLRGFLSGSRWLTLALASGWALAAALCVWLAGDLVHSYEVIPLYLACVILPVFTVGRMQDGIARSFDWINLALMPAYIWRSVLLIALMAIAFALKMPTDASTAMYAAILSTWATVLGQTLVLNQRLRQKTEVGPEDPPAAHMAGRLGADLHGRRLLSAAHLCGRDRAAAVPLAGGSRGLLRGGENAGAGGVRVLLGVGRGRPPVLRVPHQRQQGASSRTFLPTRSSGPSGPRSPPPSSSWRSANRSSGCSARNSSTATT